MDSIDIETLNRIQLEYLEMQCVRLRGWVVERDADEGIAVLTATVRR